MPGWTRDHSTLLSLILDEVVGTEEVIRMRQEYCRMKDFYESVLTQSNSYFTVSKSEGLDLPGSDMDFMRDINDTFNIKVIQGLDEIPNISSYHVFAMSSDNIHPGFTVLKHIDNNQNQLNSVLSSACTAMNDGSYLSSDLMVDYELERRRRLGRMYNLKDVCARQGPSVEEWNEYQNLSDSGTDNVISIRCSFWPQQALEWTQRQRHFGWPTTCVMSSIIDFGCHLVPVGYPLSEKKHMEWRISFSVAERTLVWSFNHVQIQCYAVLKMILKEFIKVKCSECNQVLCSYFIKTFLFWKYETTDLTFWRKNNMRECIMYLVADFAQCIREGVLRHYFIPQFNLLSVKLTREAQTELLTIFDVIIQSDIEILRECQTLRNVWTKLTNSRERQEEIIHGIKRQNIFTNDIVMRKILYDTRSFFTSSKRMRASVVNRVIIAAEPLFCQTQIGSLTMKQWLFLIHSLLLMQHGLENKRHVSLSKNISK